MLGWVAPVQECELIGKPTDAVLTSRNAQQNASGLLAVYPPPVPFNSQIFVRFCKEPARQSLKFRQRLTSATLDLGVIFLDVRHRQSLDNQSMGVSGFPICA